MMRPAILLVLLLGLSLGQAQASSVDINGARFAAGFEGDGQRWQRLGSGLFRYLIWNAYAGAYYQGEANPHPAPQARIPRHLELEYFHAIEAADFAEATRKHLRDALGATEFTALEANLREFNRHYRDVVPGDRYALTWAEERLRLRLNGELLYEGDDPDLARALFGIWLGPQPLRDDFRNALLGR
ncbi:chalcone isomerase family protein [Halomonas salifodinae]|uniref:chalcone isomerase family protein n=1 Tax=Halomonas salifodinae TaxID=438745 RepID=UPI0033BAA3AE